ncbi:hypothetical protein MIND_01353700 [Mycena indigotica]|uniref:Uncharacterized protein n=1 Tax=Mycena indigotica TaxID=2126181 RepID=A0A8H6S1W9_9AGAR|nr:uncharacterized protein MIND_01353700 [Mycena indigotica]KAF7289795.1 hypothetical protein MIND_01353700 [Mycena indigotica]
MGIGGKERAGLGRILLRTGCIYFIALLVLSLADMLVLIFDHVPAFATRYDYWVVPYYTPVFRTIIICRFLLMLRGIYYDELDGKIDGEATHIASEQLVFARSRSLASRIIGTMGAPVDASRFDGVDYEQDDEYDEWLDDQDEDSLAGVKAKDPLAAGLAMMAQPETKSKGKGKEKGDLEPGMDMEEKHHETTPPVARSPSLSGSGSASDA